MLLGFSEIHTSKYSIQYSFLIVGLVVVPWVTTAAGRLIRSGLGLNRPSSPRVNPAEPVPHESPLDVQPPAQTDFMVRSCSNLGLLYQNDVSHSTGWGCLSNNTRKKKQEQDHLCMWPCDSQEYFWKREA